MGKCKDHTFKIKEIINNDNFTIICSADVYNFISYYDKSNFINHFDIIDLITNQYQINQDLYFKKILVLAAHINFHNLSKYNNNYYYINNLIKENSNIFYNNFINNNYNNSYQNKKKFYSKFCNQYFELYYSIFNSQQYHNFYKSIKSYFFLQELNNNNNKSNHALDDNSKYYKMRININLLSGIYCYIRILSIFNDQHKNLSIPIIKNKIIICTKLFENFFTKQNYFKQLNQPYQEKISMTNINYKEKERIVYNSQIPDKIITETTIPEFPNSKKEDIVFEVPNEDLLKDQFLYKILKDMEDFTLEDFVNNTKTSLSINSDYEENSLIDEEDFLLKIDNNISNLPTAESLSHKPVTIPNTKKRKIETENSPFSAKRYKTRLQSKFNQEIEENTYNDTSKKKFTSMIQSEKNSKDDLNNIPVCSVM